MRGVEVVPLGIILRRANNDAFERHVAIAHHGTQGKGREVQLQKTIAGERNGMHLYLPFLYREA